MKLAEALSERADLQKRVAQLKVRLLDNAKTQDGERPAEDPKELLKELDGDISQLEELIRRINLTNCSVENGGETLTALLAKRDMQALKLSVLREFLKSASEKVERYSNKEIKVVSTVNVSIMQKNVDQLSKELRELDVRIQSINWSTDLIDMST